MGILNLVKKSFDNGKLSYFEKYLDFLGSKKLYPRIHEVDGPSYSPEVIIKGKKFLSFSSNNYLGLAGNQQIKSVVKNAIDEYGIGSGSTRLLAGTLDIQLKLEKDLSDFFGYSDSITFSSGYLANVGVIRMLVDPFPYFELFLEKDGVIISDELNHASIIDGVRLSKSHKTIYKHSDMASLEGHLREHEEKRKLIITDGIFSMDGDLAKIKEIGVLAKQYNALLMVDDSHGVGVLGPHGEGTAHELGVPDTPDILMGSFTKSFGSIGGFISINKTLSDYLRITARSYIFSDPIPPALVAGLIETIKIIREGDNLRKNALENSRYLEAGLKQFGFEVLGEKTTIVPLFIGNENNAINFSEILYEAGILAPCIRRPAVVEGKERIRFSVTASHSRKHIDQVLNSCEKAGRKLGII